MASLHRDAPKDVAAYYVEGDPDSPRKRGRNGASTPQNANGAAPNKRQSDDANPFKEISFRKTAEPASIPPEGRHSEFSRHNISTVAILTFINLLNYIDRYTIPGVLSSVIEFYGLTNASAGMIQVSFVLAYMVLAPLFGYLGDRFNRKYIMMFGIVFWALTTFVGSYVPKDKFGLFLFLRMLVGVGEASYSTIAPTIIADLFTDKRRTLMLSIFYFAIPIGSGLGMMGGKALAQAFDMWQAPLRATPIGGIISCGLLLFFMREPARGEAEADNTGAKTTYFQDIRALMRNKTYILVIVGFTAICFVTGCLSMWAPTFIEYAYWNLGVDPGNSTIIFGFILTVTGLAGVIIGSYWAARWRTTNPGADALVCGIGLYIAGPMLYFLLLSAEVNMNVFWVIVFFVLICLCLNWALVSDILLSVVPPHYRSTAVAIQTFTGHALGDAGSPYLLGLLSDYIQPKEPPGAVSYYALFYGLQMSFMTTAFVAPLGALAFFYASIFFPDDKKKAELMLKKVEAYRDIMDLHEAQMQREQHYSEALGDSKPENIYQSSQTPQTGITTLRYKVHREYDNYGYTTYGPEDVDVGAVKVASRVRPTSLNARPHLTG